MTETTQIEQLETKSLQELRALMVNWQNTLTREYNVLTESTRMMMKDKINEVKKVISTKENNEDQAFWADYLFDMYDDQCLTDWEHLHKH